MGLLKNVQQLNMNVNNSEKAILEHIASGKKYLVHEVPAAATGPAGIEHLLNLLYENGYNLKTMSTAGLDTSSMNRNPITLVFEKI